MTTRQEQLRKAKANERQRRKDAGLVLVSVWVPRKSAAVFKASLQERLAIHMAKHHPIADPALETKPDVG